MHARTFLAVPTLLVAALATRPAFAQTPPDAAPDLRLESLESGTWTPGRARAFARMPDGSLLVGGHFDRAQGSVLRGNLLRLRPDGSIDPGFAPDFSSSTAMEIEAIAVAGGKIYVGGLFEAVGATPRFSLVRLDTDGALDASWTAPFNSTSQNEVTAIAVTANGVFVGGDLIDDDAFGLMKLDPATGARDASWVAQTQYNPTGSPSAGNRGEIDVIVPVGDSLYVGGEFGQVAGVEKRGLALISQTGPVSVAAFDAGIVGRASSLALSGRLLYVGGTFFRAEGPGANYLNRVDAASGALDTFWAPTLDNSVETMDLIGRTLYVGGYFQSNAPGARIARIPVDGVGEVDPTFAPYASGGHVEAIIDDCHGHIMAGGDYLEISGADRWGFAAFSTSDVDCLFANGFDGD